MRLIPFVALLLVTGCGPAPDAARRLGLRGMLGYHVRAGAASEVPANDVGFVVTANGVGGYRVAWVAFTGSRSTYSGSVTTDGRFDANQIAGLSGRETITVTTDLREIDFSSVADGYADGVDFVPSTDPIYLDVRIDGGLAHCYFTGADTGRVLLSAYDPVAFTSP